MPSRVLRKVKICAAFLSTRGCVPRCVRMLMYFVEALWVADFEIELSGVTAGWCKPAAAANEEEGRHPGDSWRFPGEDGAVPQHG